MRVLIANLKLYSLRVWFWCACAALGMVTHAFLFWGRLIDEDGAALAILMLDALVLGFLIGTKQALLATRPFVFCLPGRRRAMHRVFLATGVIVCVMMSWLYIVFFEWHIALQGALTAMHLPALAVFFAVHLLGVIGGFTLLGWGLLVVFFLVLPFVGYESATGPYFTACAGLERMLVQHPAGVVAGAAVAAGVVWLGLIHVPIVPPAKEALEGDSSTRTTSSRLDRALFHRFSRCGHLRPWKHVWGMLYLTQLNANWRLMLVALLVVTALFCYMGMTRAMLLVFVPLMLIGNDGLPVHWQLFPAGGRRERYRAAMVLLLLVWIISVVLSAGMIGIANLLVPVAPSIEIGRLALVPKPVDVRYLWMPLLITPVAGLGWALLHERRTLLFILAMTLLSFLGVFTAPLWEAMPVAVPPLTNGYGLAGIVPAWILCAGALHRVVTRRDLVRKRSSNWEVRR